MKKTSPFLSNAILLSFLLLCTTMMAQKHGPNSEEDFGNDFNFQQTALDSLLLWQEQVVLHTNKELVLPKDFIFFKAYVLTGPKHVRVSSSAVLKVELLDAKGNLVKSQYHKIEEGTSNGSFEIPKKLREGDYYFRAYTRWMLNYGPDYFATKKVRIGSLRDQVKTTLIVDEKALIFPEGGNLVSGLNNRVAVKLDDFDHRDLPVVNSNNEEVAFVKHYGNGLGTFLIKPKKGEQYAIKISENQKIPLPELQDMGYTIQMNNLNSESLLVRIEASSELKGESLVLKGKAGGVSYFEKNVDFNDRNVLEITIPKENIPKGIGYLQLEDEFGQIWAKRPLYHEGKELQIRLEGTSQEGEKSILEVKVTDTEGNPVLTELSVALGAQRRIDKGNKGISSSGMSLRNQRYLNDLLVLTGQSSKLFVGNVTNELPSEIRYDFQNGLDFYGQAYDLDKSLLMNSKIQVLILTEDEAIAQEVETNSEGLFKLSGLSIDGEVKIVFRTVGEESKTKLVQVIPFEYETPPLFKSNRENVITRVDNRKAKQSNQRKKAVDFLSGDKTEDELIALDGVTLIEKKGYQKLTPSIYNLEPSRVMFQDYEKPKTIPQLFLGIAGVYVTGLGDLNPEVTLLQAAGVGPVLWVLDGMPLIQPTSLVDIINLVNYRDVERIEIFYGAKAAIYGTRAAGGAIIIYTRNGSDENHIARKLAQLSYEGYHNSMDFEAYEQTVPKKILKAEGIPTTVYWNPVLKTDENGKAFIQFDTPKDIDTYYLDVRGITEDGKRGAVKTVWSF
ncbi:TonB-dependent receptor [Flagellimonas allohymeniacidonis]|uniref:Plug domain-containing protein n=1 Tax=Flagellimonas allohymeniacidonis TaxID=2517819 RepID=A0A4Q8QI42_9FLAO|nr:Plug domain-containing protein [Allomuricauda hymeniacidonis]TAI48343.1 Plug domain-containing protein [Allomuricauda hymeniacidonis]